MLLRLWHVRAARAEKGVLLAPIEHLLYERRSYAIMYVQGTYEGTAMATATLTRMGNSVGVAIPKEFRGPGFELGDKVTIEYDGGSLRLTPVRRPMTLQSLMDGYEGPSPEIVDLGAPMGRELW